MDLTIDVEDYKLNVRAAGVIIHNNKILAHKDIRSDHYALIGGRIEIGENSADTIKREIKEELGKDIEITGYIATIENFFKMKETKYHEIMFIHKIEFTDEKDKKIEYTMKNIEGKDYLQYEWLDLDKIEEYPLLPHAVASPTVPNNKADAARTFKAFLNFIFCFSFVFLLYLIIKSLVDKITISPAAFLKPPQEIDFPVNEFTS